MQRLGANTTVYRNEDSQSEMIRFIVHLLDQLPEEMYEKTLRNYIDNHVPADNNRKRMVFDCLDFFKVLVRLFRFEFFAESEFISVTTIYSWTGVTLGVCVNSIFFLCFGCYLICLSHFSSGPSILLMSMMIWNFS